MGYIFLAGEGDCPPGRVLVKGRCIPGTAPPSGVVKTQVNSLSESQKREWLPVRQALRKLSWDGNKYYWWWPLPTKSSSGKMILVGIYDKKTKKKVTWPYVGMTSTSGRENFYTLFWYPEKWDYSNNTGKGVWIRAPFAPKHIEGYNYDVAPVTDYGVYKSDNRNALEKAGDAIVEAAKDAGGAIKDAGKAILKHGCKFATDSRTGKAIDIAKKIPEGYTQAGARIVQGAGSICRMIYPGDPGYGSAAPLPPSPPPSSSASTSDGSGNLILPLVAGAAILLLV